MIGGKARLPRDPSGQCGIRIDGEAISTWSVFGMYDTWKWSPLGRHTSGNPEKFFLGPGRHTLSFYAEESLFIPGDLIITNDPSFYPVSEMKSTGY